MGGVFVAELLAVMEGVLTGIEQAVDCSSVGFVIGELQIHGCDHTLYFVPFLRSGSDFVSFNLSGS